MSDQTIIIHNGGSGSTKSLTNLLSFEGYTVRTAADIREHANVRGVHLVAGPTPRAEVAALRAIGVTSSVIAVVEDRLSVVPALNIGADDAVVVLPNGSDAELLARLRALFRRTNNRIDAEHPERLVVGDLEMDIAGHTVMRSGEVVHLTRLEFDLLRTLMEASPSVVSRDKIVTKLWPQRDASKTNVLEVYTGYLRKKVEGEGKPKIIHTVRGVGLTAKIDD